jgi:uncharacterized membrane protein
MWASVCFNVISQFTSVAFLALMGPLWYGLSVMALRATREEKVAFGDCFVGFNRFAPTCFMGMLLLFLSTVPSMVLITMTTMAGFSLLVYDHFAAFVLVSAAGNTISLLPCCAAIMLYLPAFFIIHDYKYDFWPAMEASRKMVWTRFRYWSEIWVVLSIPHFILLALFLVAVIFFWSSIPQLETITIENAEVLVVPLLVLAAIALAMILVLIVIVPWSLIVLALAYNQEKSRIPGPQPPPLPTELKVGT